MKQAILFRLIAILGIFISCHLAGEQGLFYKLDHAIAEKRMALEGRPSSGDIVLLEIDNKSLTAIGLWPWKRSIYADIVEKAFAAGAEELAFDIDFSSSSQDREDRAFGRALENAVGPVTLAVFQQHSTANTQEASIQTNRPIAALGDNAWLATVNVLADRDGFIRHFPFAQEFEGELYPSLTSVLGGVQTISPGTFTVDYGIDPVTIPTHSVIDLINGNLAQDALKNKKVLIGAGAAELRDTLTVPVFGMMSGPKLQILAAENLLQGRGLTYAPGSWQLGLSIMVLGLVMVISLLRLRNSFIKIASLAAAAITIEAVAFWIYHQEPLILQTGLLQGQLALSGIVLTLFEIRFKDFLLTLLVKRSDSLSALLQTIVSDSFSGILIVDDSRRIVEISQRAELSLAEIGFEAKKGADIIGSAPEEIVTLITQSLDHPDSITDHQSLSMLKIGTADEERYFEYSITPSLIASGDSTCGHDKHVTTLLFHDVTAARREQLRLEYLADHDSLTGLLNRSGFCTQTDEIMIARMEQDALIFACQGQRIEKVTQSLGAEYADLLMREIAERLRALDLFDRIGCSDQREFLLCRIGASEVQIPQLVTRIRTCLETPFNVRGHNIIVGSSIGIADFGQGRLLTDEVVNAATVALHRSKETGDSHLFYTTNLAADVLHRRVLEREIIDAMTREEFEIHYQPQASLKSGKVIGCEALIRWHHRDLGFIRPDLFIPILEETGMIADLGRWILETACTDAMNWPKDVTVAVNVSAAQFGRSDILDDIRSALEKSGLPRARLQIEITESLFIADPDAIIATLDSIREAGIKIALDDFGTGYSSLSYIHQFPLDKLKIDRAFVKDLPQSLESLAVINAVTALARGLDMDIVAEGIETAAQAEALRIASCQIGQGFHFGRPMSHSDFCDHLTAEQTRAFPAPDKTPDRPGT